MYRDCGGDRAAAGLYIDIEPASAGPGRGGSHDRSHNDEFCEIFLVVILLERENVLRAMNALTAIGYRPLIPVDAAQFADERLRQQWRDDKGMIVFQMLNPQRESTRIDIFVTEPFVFEEEFERAKRHKWGDMQAPVIRIEALIAMKQATGRPQDLADAAMLRDILEQQIDAE